MTIASYLKEGLPTVAPKEVLNLENVTLIDVRMPEEYVGELGHVEGTRLITLGTELDQFLSTANKDSNLIFICRSGARSGRATAAALALGFKQSYNMEGGMIAWNNQSLPTAK